MLLADLTSACGDSPSSICEWVWDRTENESLAKLVDWAVERPLRILLILLVAFVISRLLRRAVARFVARLAETSSKRLHGWRQTGPGRLLIEQAENRRADARARTVGDVLGSVATAAVWTVALLMVLGELDINIGPLLAGAGIAGIAFGFGAQTIVRDFLSGLFMLIEDQYGVGDFIDVGEVNGEVEEVSLRTTTLRDIKGTLWHVPNGEIRRVANMSQLWSRAVLDVSVAYEADAREAQDVIKRVADELWQDPEWSPFVLEEPQVLGVQDLGADGVDIRVLVKTEPAVQWKVERELRLRLKETLTDAGIDIPYPQRTVWLKQVAAPDQPGEVTERPAE
ncbi:MAG: mechanosensitive ion channel family protein [Acidimicrobiales bacterium]|nr:mechanosensitive ion channel family protein [Acidimicrobiales bacterium]